MWGIGTAALTVAVLLAPSPAVPELPEPRPQPFQGCVLPLTSVLDPCPPDGRDLPPGGCILPVQGLQREPLRLVPEDRCPERDPDLPPGPEVFPLGR